MFKYKFYEFFNKENEVLTIQFENSKFLIGEFLTESSIINLCSLINNKIKGNINLINEINWSFFPFNIISEDSNDISNIKEIFTDLKVIIIPNFGSIIGYILIYKLILENEQIFNINKETINKIMIYSTEPIIQFAQCYLNEFYSAFNSLLINYTIKRNSNEKDLLNQKMDFINNNDRENFINHIISINYNEKINYLVPLSSNSNSLLNSNETSSLIEKYISFELCSNEYELGSSNILFHYYNKKIFIITKSSFFNDRYPLKFDSNSAKNCDFLLVFPEVVNKNNNNSVNYQYNFKALMETLMKSSTYDSKDLKCIHNYPYTLILTSPFFMLEFCDVFKYRLNITKTVYFSKAMKSLLKYSNASVGFLNNKLVNKIFDFRMPFCFDELEKDKSMVIFNDVIEFQNQLINMVNNNTNPVINNLYNFGITQNTYANKGKKITKDDSDLNYDNKKEFVKNLIDRMSPFCFISHFFSIYNSNNKEIIDFFMNNYDNKYDKIIIISNNSDCCDRIFQEIKNKLNLEGVTFENYVLDYRINNEQLNEIIKDINPKFKLNNEITKEYREINLIYDEKYSDKNLSYNNSYILSNNNKGILNLITNNSELELEFSKEQLRYNIDLKSNKKNNNNESKTRKSKKKKGSENLEENKMDIDEEKEEQYAEYSPLSIEESEDILGKYLEMNDMEITEYLKDENSIEITVYNKIKKTYTEIKINNYYQDNKDAIDKEKESKKGRSSKSKSSKKSKSKEKANAQMDIEDEGKDKKIEEEMNKDLPSLEINSEDTDDSLFLNSLFNSILI